MEGSLLRRDLVLPEEEVCAGEDDQMEGSASSQWSVGLVVEEVSPRLSL